MAVKISRRTALAAAAAATVALPGTIAHTSSHKPISVRFVLNAITLDGGEQITSLTLATSHLGLIDPASVSTATFSVHATATNPIALSLFDQSGGYDLDRPVTAAQLDPHGNIVLWLGYGEGQPGGSTLAYLASRGRNFRLALDYTITHNIALTLRSRQRVTITRFTQGDLANTEVDSFTHHISGSGMKYRLYSPTPARSDKHPLIVWLHGGGEGASPPDNYYDNETPLRANRGALGFTTGEAQRIFQGAYVVVPQCTSAWMDNGPRFAPLIRDIIQDVARTRAVDPGRIYVAGASNGGYMTMKMTTVFPDMFAAAVPISGVVDLQTGAPPLISDAELAAIHTPTWLVASHDDTTINPQANTIHAHDLIPGSLMTLYDHVTWNGHPFLGHFSWIYTARNDPTLNGTHLWQWMAHQQR